MRVVNQAKLSAFIEAYSPALVRAVEKYPDEYGYGIEKVPLVVSKMRISLEKGDYNHDSKGFRYACRDLGIPHTRKAIEAFIQETP